MTDTLRTRLARTALDTADNVAAVTAGAAAGLTTYRTLASRQPETRITLALAAGALAAAVTDQHAYKALAPLRRRLGIERAFGRIPGSGLAPSLEQLTAEVAVDAAHRAAAAAHTLDHSSGSLTWPTNWVGASDGTATCALPGGAHLLCVPSPADQHGYRARTYLLVRNEKKPIEIRSISELAALLDGPTDAAQPTDSESEAEYGDPWAALGRDLAIAELCPTVAAADGEDQADEDDNRDQEAEAHDAGLL
ncbi:hypothetical protein [Kitasatospora sp. NPDC054795]